MLKKWQLVEEYKGRLEYTELLHCLRYNFGIKVRTKREREKGKMMIFLCYVKIKLRILTAII